MKPYVFVWSRRVRPFVRTLPRPKMLDLRGHCYKLIERAEAALENQRGERAGENPDPPIYCLGVEPLQEKDSPFAPFPRYGQTFRLRCTKNERFGQREYALVFADDTQPNSPDEDDDEGDAITLESSGKSKPAARGEARPARVRKPRKTTLKDLFISYKSYNKEMSSRIRSAIWTRLARTVQITRTSAEFAWLSGLKWADHLSVCRDCVNSARRRIRAMIEAQSLGVEAPVSRCGRLEPRLSGQNLGVHLLLYTMVFEEPIDWSADLFGVPNHEGEQATA